MKTGLILEGGAMRGMFTAGVIDVLMENGIKFDGEAYPPSFSVILSKESAAHMPLFSIHHAPSYAHGLPLTPLNRR